MSETNKSNEAPSNGQATYGPASPELFSLESQRMLQVSGVLGRLFGNAEHAPTNIAGFVVVMVLVFAGISMCFPSTVTPSEYWKIATPILTLSLGYLFGKKS